IREYIAKGIDIDNITEEQIEPYVYKLNTRPRNRFDWKTPAELFNAKVLHLICQLKANKNTQPSRGKLCKRYKQIYK
ncbi:hypothetical protein NW110_11630, partial [Staphylococcus pettenkoferi]|nr:hypothetical protein [Staphylococcus pettenkoferi]